MSSWVERHLLHSLRWDSDYVCLEQQFLSSPSRINLGKSVSSSCDPITSDLYDEAQKSGLPEKAVLASLGCGNPTALAELKPGETVLDLGSGGGFDVLLSAKRVGPSGKDTAST